MAGDNGDQGHAERDGESDGDGDGPPTATAKRDAGNATAQLSESPSGVASHVAKVRCDDSQTSR
jgi:hypothetical protein